MSGRNVEMIEGGRSWLMSREPVNGKGNSLYERGEDIGKMSAEEVIIMLKKKEIRGVVVAGGERDRDMCRHHLADSLSIFVEEKGQLFREFLRELGEIPVESAQEGDRVIFPWGTEDSHTVFASVKIVRNKKAE